MKKENETRIYHEISLYNNSQIKISFQDYGYLIGKEKYNTKYPSIAYDLERPIKEKHLRPNGKVRKINYVYDEKITHFPFYIHEGEYCRFGLFPGDYKINEKYLNKKLYIYIKINGKIYKCYTGITLHKYLSLTRNIKDKSPYNKE